MIAARLARASFLSWFAALLWKAAVAIGIAEARTLAYRTHEPALNAHAAALPVARAMGADENPRVSPQNRWGGDALFAPEKETTLIRSAEAGVSRAQTATERSGLPRPRRFAFRYDATAPPRSL